ncbi:putative DNA-binding transcriptional regulator AlpA [Undibacterium sp. GrIS 1.8]|uniref:helix-turn-helix transcriptional regulator n=1 Tax=Undibacterium sp. GrIS 1.8 TaxID=3143934 RepID=UPI0033997D47
MSNKSQIALLLDEIKKANLAEPISQLPQLLFSDDISRITGLSITTIRHYTGNAEKFGHLLPRWFKLPGARRLAWLPGTVTDWIQAGINAAPQPKRRRGRPTKASQAQHGH